MPAHALTSDHVRARSPYVVAPVADWYQAATTNAIGGANNHLSAVCRIPVTGTLRDVMVYVHVSSGNVSATVYDVAAGTGTRNRLWASGSVACGAQGWQIIGDPNLAVTEGQLVALGIGCDNVTATFGRYENPLSGPYVTTVPAAYVPEGAIRAAVAAGSSFPDPGATWATPGATTLMMQVVARVQPS